MRVSLLKRRLFELEWPVERLAYEAGVSAATANRMLSGTQVSVRTVRKAAKALGLKFDEVWPEAANKFFNDTRTHETGVVS